MNSSGVNLWKREGEKEGGEGGREKGGEEGGEGERKKVIT